MNWIRIFGVRVCRRKTSDFDWFRMNDTNSANFRQEFQLLQILIKRSLRQKLNDSSEILWIFIFTTVGQEDKRELQIRLYSLTTTKLGRIIELKLFWYITLLEIPVFNKMALIFNLEKARRILIEILKNLASPENSKRLSEAKSEWDIQVIWSDLILLLSNKTIFDLVCLNLAKNNFYFRCIRTRDD